MKQVQASRSARVRGPHPWVRAVLRLGALLLILQLTGAGSLVSAWAGSPDAGCSERCADDDDRSQGSQCPPSCPSCTCAHAAWSGLPVVAPGDTGVRLAPVAVLTAPRLSVPHRKPSLSGIFRPPRG